ncbi:MAG: hypothetical protein HY363_06445 [Candidatus Aenigmarchaeota archaeon]|nr:hypothetical protein [Candidatus Aenigmarchaeota archaeon]
MIDKKSFELMRRQFEQFDALREQLIKMSRDILKNSKGAIYSVHRNEISVAALQLAEAKKTIKKIELLIKKDIHLAQVGAWFEALEEYVEASCYYGFVTEKKIPTAKEVGVDAEVYLPGVCDFVGELTRRAVNAAIKEDYKSALEIKEVVTELYAELMLFDLRNIPARKKFDSIKYSLEKLEDIALKIKMKN